MEGYLLYIAIASATIASPGPGVVLTVSNTIKYGFTSAWYGILGVAIGMLSIAILSATSLAVILATSAIAFTVLKFIGALYLIYLGIKMWRSSASLSIEDSTNEATNKNLKRNNKENHQKRFKEGLLITLLNPKPIFFFMALFPQFIDTTASAPMSYGYQFLLLTMTFSVLVMVIHSAYAFFAQTARKKLSTPKGSRLLNKISGVCYTCFGIGLATTFK